MGTLPAVLLEVLKFVSLWNFCAAEFYEKLLRHVEVFVYVSPSDFDTP